MLANVNEALWIDFNLDTAVFLDTIAYWLKKNAANKLSHNFQDGRYWTYITEKGLGTMFPGWSRETIRRVIRNCVSNGLLLKGNFNRKGYDRTSWYSLTDKALEYYPKLTSIIYLDPENPDSDSMVDFNHPLVGSNPAIPILQPTSSNNTITAIAPASKPKKDSSQQMLREMIDAYREIFPDNPQPHKTAISTSLERAMRTVIRRWPEVTEGEEFTLDWFKRYLRGLKELAPKFSLKSYVTKDGRVKKNGLLTFCRWDTVVHFSEDKFS